MRVWFLKEPKSICTVARLGVIPLLAPAKRHLSARPARKQTALTLRGCVITGRLNFTMLTRGAINQTARSARLRPGGRELTTAIARAVDDLRRFQGDEIAVIASGKMTNEELWLTKKLIEALGIKYHDIVPTRWRE